MIIFLRSSAISGPSQLVSVIPALFWDADWPSCLQHEYLNSNENAVAVSLTFPWHPAGLIYRLCFFIPFPFNTIFDREISKETIPFFFFRSWFEKWIQELSDRDIKSYFDRFSSFEEWIEKRILFSSIKKLIIFYFTVWKKRRKNI